MSRGRDNCPICGNTKHGQAYTCKAKACKLTYPFFKWEEWVNEKEKNPKGGHECSGMKLITDHRGYLKRDSDGDAITLRRFIFYPNKKEVERKYKEIKLKLKLMEKIIDIEGINYVLDTTFCNQKKFALKRFSYESVRY